LREAIKIIHEHGKKAYVAVNAIFHNEHIADLEAYIDLLHELNVDRIIFGDPAVLMAVKEQENPIPLNWNAETIVTNHIQCNNCGERGANRAILSREIILEEVIIIKRYSIV